MTDEEYIKDNKGLVMMQAERYFNDAKLSSKFNKNKKFDELNEKQKRYYIRDAEICVLMIKENQT